jgi:hypothetical protein
MSARRTRQCAKLFIHWRDVVEESEKQRHAGQPHALSSDAGYAVEYTDPLYR